MFSSLIAWMVWAASVFLHYFANFGIIFNDKHEKMSPLKKLNKNPNVLKWLHQRNMRKVQREMKIYI